MQKLLLKIRHFEKGLSKSFMQLSLFFISNQVLFNVKNNQKHKQPGTSDQSPFRLQNKSRKIILLVMYYLTKFDDVI